MELEMELKDVSVCTETEFDENTTKEKIALRNIGEAYRVDKSGKNCVTRILTTAYKEEEDAYTFICHVNNSIHTTVLGYFILLATFLLSITSVVFGVLRFNSCPCEPGIPIFLTLNGIALFTKNVFKVIKSACKIPRPTEERHFVYTAIDIITLFLIFWNMTGGVWVFGVFRKVQTEQSFVHKNDYCDVVVYWIAVSMVMSMFITILCKGLMYVFLWIIHDKMENDPDFCIYQNEAQTV